MLISRFVHHRDRPRNACARLKALEMFANCADRGAAGDVPPLERPTVNATGRLYGMNGSNSTFPSYEAKALCLRKAWSQTGSPEKCFPMKSTNSFTFSVRL